MLKCGDFQIMCSRKCNLPLRVNKSLINKMLKEHLADLSDVVERLFKSGKERTKVKK